MRTHTHTHIYSFFFQPVHINICCVQSLRLSARCKLRSSSFSRKYTDKHIKKTSLYCTFRVRLFKDAVNC